jgi:hypothetical protein
VILTGRRRPRPQDGSIPELGSLRNADAGMSLVSPNVGGVVRIHT